MPLVAKGVVEVIMAAMQRHRDSAAVAENGCGALWNIAVAGACADDFDAQSRDHVCLACLFAHSNAYRACVCATRARGPRTRAFASATAVHMAVRLCCKRWRSWAHPARLHCSPHTVGSRNHPLS